MTKTKFYITDVFTSEKYGGNQLATFIDCAALSGQEMQAIAREINFSETTFVLSSQPRDGGYDVRIFTPTCEVPFAGHPTLGTAHVIGTRLLDKPADEIRLNLPIGQIPVRFSEPDKQTLWMKQAAPEFGKTVDAGELAAALGLAAGDIDTRYPCQEVSTGLPHTVVPLTTLNALKRAKINKDKYFELIGDAWAKLILVFSREAYQTGHALGVRVFADFYGIEEDAATGSGNGCLAAYLVRHKVMQSSSISLTAGQGYEIGRPSQLHLRATNSPHGIDVFVGGAVVDVAEGFWG